MPATRCLDRGQVPDDRRDLMQPMVVLSLAIDIQPRKGVIFKPKPQRIVAVPWRRFLPNSLDDQEN